MASNVEIKCRARDFEKQMSVAAKLAGGAPEVLVQEDTFFDVESGRMKLRRSGETAELISYERPDRCGPRESVYTRRPVERPDSLMAAMRTSIGIAGVVRKTRKLFIVDGDRIHFDDVEGLGQFIEIEAVVDEGRDRERAGKAVERLMKKLGIRPSDLVACAYIDLISRERKNGGHTEDDR